MEKKITFHKEDPSINFRLPKELKIQILDAAKLNNQTVSNYLREHMESFLSGELYQKEIAEYEAESFINTNEFLQLVVWTYQKRNENKHVVTDIINQDYYISTIKSIGSQLPCELVEEFDKVLLDLMKVKNEKGDFKMYTFCRSDYPYENGFNYGKLETYLLKTGLEVHKVYV